MSNENVETLRAGIDAFNRRDFDAATGLVRDDVVWERFVSRTESNDPMVRGKEELLAVWRAQVDMIDIRLDPEEVVPAGDDRVIARIRMLAHGTQSDVNVSSIVTWMWTFDERGLVRAVETFDSVEAALEAAAESRD